MVGKDGLKLVPTRSYTTVFYGVSVSIKLVYPSDSLNVARVCSRDCNRSRSLVDGDQKQERQRLYNIICSDITNSS